MADDIFDLLKADHDRHRVLLEALGKTKGDSDDRRRLFDAFRIEVSAHADAEEQSLYATMLANPDLQGEGRHSVSEHKEIEDFLEELDDMSFSNPHWLEKFTEMRHRYEHHIDEEEQEIFVAAKKDLSATKAKELAAIFRKRKPAELEEYREEVAAEG